MKLLESLTGLLKLLEGIYMAKKKNALKDSLEAVEVLLTREEEDTREFRKFKLDSDIVELIDRMGKTTEIRNKFMNTILRAVFEEKGLL